MEHKFIRNRDIVMFSSQPWDTEIGSNFKDMALELAKYNRVLYVNRALDRSSRIKHKDDHKVKARLASIREGLGEMEQVQQNLWVQNPRTILESINRIPFHFVHDYINKVNNKRLAAEINKGIEKLGFNDVILINDNDFVRGFYQKELVKCSDFIFYIRDFMLGVDFFKKHGPRHEAGIMRKADMVVANSSYLAEYSRKQNANSFDIGQGCDLTQFLVRNLPKPADLQNIPGPVIGYTGNLSIVRIDFPLIRHIAANLPECSIVLVGPADPEFRQEELSDLKNIYFLGAKPPDQLASYITHFDVCINPQILNVITVGNYPRKVDEYLAMGKPIVATATEAMRMFENHTFLCASKEEYVEKIKMILANPALSAEEMQESRRQFALSHTWENSIGLMGDAYHQVKQAKRTGNGRA
ncbi:MAG: glycosyltransferase [Gemmatimonadaceae bacterium]|nr:glycosyltransferase [Chitinophagaceae bacterium]